MPFCNQCGNKLDEDSSFCIKCGAPAVKARAAEPAIIPEAAPEIGELAGTPREAEMPVIPETAPEIEAAEPCVVPEESPEPVYTAPAEPTYAPPAYEAAPPLAYGSVPPAYGAPPVYSQPMATPGGNTFLNSYLSIIVLGVLLSGLIAFVFIYIPAFFSPINLGMVFAQGICMFGPVAFATIVSTRAKGPDLSIGHMMALSSAIIGTASIIYGLPLALGIVISLFVCAVIGIINGALITYLRAPAVIVTLITGVIARGILNLLLDGQTLPVERSIAAIANYKIGELSLGGLIILVVTFIAAFLLVMLTKLGVPTHKRDKKPAISYMFAYMASALIAAVGGIYMMSRYMAASPIAGSGFERFILLVFACIAGSRVVDNRFAPVVYTLASLLLYSVLTNVLSILMLEIFWQICIEGVLILILLAVAFLSRLFNPARSSDADLSNAGINL